MVTMGGGEEGFNNLKMEVPSFVYNRTYAWGRT